MITMLFKLTGGIGLFLLGMVLLTDGLKAFAGEALRRALVRFTGTPLKAFGSGALITVLVQSSSATTVTVIGFVSAGLLTFPQAVGVVFGASLGTTGTGWIVSVLGLKVSVGFYALPLVGFGAFMKLLAKGRLKQIGLALAGFGLIFIGIETLQDGMQALSGYFNLSELPARGFGGRIMIMAAGALMTVIMQSSSAAVATTLTALHTGAVNFEQASALVIGAAVGTTVTGALAAIGGSVPAKRTALAHVLFNLSTGLIAVAILPVFLYGIGVAQARIGLAGGATSLAAFHTVFIAAGVLLFLPFVNQFARFIEWLLPEEGPALTRHFDDTLLHAPAVALETTRRALNEAACQLFNYLRADGLGEKAAEGEVRFGQVLSALEETQRFFARIPPLGEDEPLSESRVSQMHAIDHLIRLQGRARVPEGIRSILAHKRLGAAVDRARELLELAEDGLHGTASPDWVERLEQLAFELAELRRQERPVVLRQTAEGRWEPATALQILDAFRWLDRVGYHTWRICNYLGGSGKPELAVVEEGSETAS
jgi:phosphate:Na+ symporter